MLLRRLFILTGHFPFAYFCSLNDEVIYCTYKNIVLCLYLNIIKSLPSNRII